jgi:hypothetical protein
MDWDDSRAELLINLHSYLFDYADAYVSDALDFILSAGFVNTRAAMGVLSSNLMLAVDIRPLFIADIINLCCQLAVEAPCLPHVILRHALRDVTKARLYFLYHGMKRGLFSRQSISDVIAYSIPITQNSLLVQLLFWFAPEVQEFHASFFAERETALSSQWSFISNVEQLKTLRDQDHPLELVEVLRSDNVDKLLELINGGQVNVNTTMPSFLYGPFDILTTDPTILGYAIFFGFIECFKQLKSSNAPDDPCGAELAVAGGNCQVISMLDRSQVDSRLLTARFAIINTRYISGCTHEWRVRGLWSNAAGRITCGRFFRWKACQRTWIRNFSLRVSKAGRRLLLFCGSAKTGRTCIGSIRTGA